MKYLVNKYKPDDEFLYTKDLQAAELLSRDKEWASAMKLISNLDLDSEGRKISEPLGVVG